MPCLNRSVSRKWKTGEHARSLRRQRRAISWKGSVPIFAWRDRGRISRLLSRLSNCARRCAQASVACPADEARASWAGRNGQKALHPASTSDSARYSPHNTKRMSNLTDLTKLTKGRQDVKEGRLRNERSWSVVNGSERGGSSGPRRTRKDRRQLDSYHPRRIC